MSVCFIVVPTVVVAWPVFAAAAAAAAAQLGYKAAVEAQLQSAVVAEKHVVELSIDNSEVLTGQVRLDDELILNKDDLVVRVYKDARGQCAIHVHGEGRSDEELRREGTALLNKIKQQYTYQKVTQELQERGFSIASQEATEDGRIRVRLRKFE